MDHRLLPPLLLLLSLSLFAGSSGNRVGVNYGMVASNLPSVSESVKNIKLLNASAVKIYDANSDVLGALRNTSIKASVMLPNELIVNFSFNQTLADSWVKSNISRFWPETKIHTLLIGNEILSDYPNRETLWPNLVPAMIRLRHSLKKSGLKNIKVSTPHAMDVLSNTFPASNATFRQDIAQKIMWPLLYFLNRTKSCFFVDVYPYFSWANNWKKIKLDYALLEEKATPRTDPLNNVKYFSLLDEMLAAVAAAIDRAGFPKVCIVMAETGWPTAGDLDQIGANTHNAAIYNRNLAKMLNKKHPRLAVASRLPLLGVHAYVFALYNENNKPGPSTERHWGLFFPNGTKVYEVDLSGEKNPAAYERLPKPNNNKPYKGKLWCISKMGATKTELKAAVEWACKQVNVSCDAFRKGGTCYDLRQDLRLRASYAFTVYWKEYRPLGGNCYFSGLAEETTANPVKGTCNIPAVNPSKE